MKPKQTFTLLEARQELAKQSNQRFWDLLETSNRTSTEDEELLLAAYASIYLWKEVGTAVHTQRGYWLVARAYISLHQADDAISWAEKCLKITEKNPEEMEDFDLAYAQESLARAYAKMRKIGRYSGVISRVVTGTSYTPNRDPPGQHLPSSSKSLLN
ncbi:MAG: hypothetical protein P8Y34_02870 [Anaerolineales bacterium]